MPQIFKWPLLLTSCLIAPSTQADQLIELTCRPVFEYQSKSNRSLDGLNHDELIPYRKRFILDDGTNRIVFSWPMAGQSWANFLTNLTYTFTLEAHTNDEPHYEIIQIIREEDHFLEYRRK
jgi:hypothetical protein